MPRCVDDDRRPMTTTPSIIVDKFDDSIMAASVAKRERFSSTLSRFIKIEDSSQAKRTRNCEDRSTCAFKYDDGSQVADVKSNCFNFTILRF